MIEFYKITHGTYDDTVKKILTPMTKNVQSTRGNSKRLYHIHRLKLRNEDTHSTYG